MSYFKRCLQNIEKMPPNRAKSRDNIVGSIKGFITACEGAINILEIPILAINRFITY